MKTQKLRLYFHAIYSKHASYIHVLSSIRIFRYPYSALFLAVLLFSRYIVIFSIYCTYEITLRNFTSYVALWWMHFVLFYIYQDSFFCLLRKTNFGDISMIYFDWIYISTLALLLIVLHFACYICNGIMGECIVSIVSHRLQRRRCFEIEMKISQFVFYR